MGSSEHTPFQQLHSLQLTLEWQPEGQHQVELEQPSSCSSDSRPLTFLKGAWCAGIGRFTLSIVLAGLLGSQARTAWSRPKTSAVCDFLPYKVKLRNSRQVWPRLSPSLIRSLGPVTPLLRTPLTHLSHKQLLLLCSCVSLTLSFELTRYPCLEFPLLHSLGWAPCRDGSESVLGSASSLPGIGPAFSSATGGWSGK